MASYHLMTIKGVLGTGMQVISNKSMKFDDQKVFDASQVFDDPRGIAIGSMDFPKVSSDTSIFDGLV